MFAVKIAKSLGLVVSMIGCFALAVVLNRSLEERRPALPPGLKDADLDLKGSRLKGFSFGMEGLIADWYYMRALQYIGDKLLTKKPGEVNIDDLSSLNPRLLHPLLDSATDLDPNYLAAYRYGTVVLPAIDPEKAIALGQKGIANNPGQWRLYQQLGYVYWRLGRYEEAADVYERGSKAPGASPFMKLMAATMRSDGNSRATFRAVYQELLENSSDPNTIDMAERRLREMDATDEREAIDRVLVEFRMRYNRCPQDLAEIFSALQGVELAPGSSFRVNGANQLVDPFGTPYSLDRQACRLNAPTGGPNR